MSSTAIPTTTPSFAPTLSTACGWLYTLAWSLSFYPQPLLNLSRRSTSGLTPDFPLLNVFGFTCYTLSTAVFLFSPVIRSQYAARHPVSPEPTVRGNDLAFGAHALVLCVITYSQFWPGLWGWSGEGKGRVRKTGNRVSMGLVVGSLLAVAVLVAIVLVDGDGDDARGWAWIDVIYSFSYIKLLLTVFKYIPQAIANYRRKSTSGWAIGQVLLDFSGGILSLVQLVIDSALQNDWSGLTGNPMKLGLANVSVLFDVVFILQHYCLYGPVEGKGGRGVSGEENGGVDPEHGSRGDGEREALLSRGRG